MTGRAHTTLGKMTQGGRPKRRREPLRVGRQTKLTPEVSKRICDAIRAGNFVSVAARYAGVSEYTVMQWLMRGRGEHPTLSQSAIYVQFLHDVDEAEAASEVAAVLHWRSAMPKDWHASEKYLLTRYADRWAPKSPEMARSGAFAGVQVNIGGQSGGIGPSEGQNALQAPISTLLEENPALIAGTMQLLDQFLPIDPNSVNSTQFAEIRPESAESVKTDDIEGEFTEIESEVQPESPETHFRRTFDANEVELDGIE